MKKKKQKQTKADKAFIEKIKSLGIGTGAKSDDASVCECGGELEVVGKALGLVDNKIVYADIYAHKADSQAKPRRKKKVEAPDESSEQSFSA